MTILEKAVKRSKIEKIKADFIKTNNLLLKYGISPIKLQNISLVKNNVTTNNISFVFALICLIIAVFIFLLSNVLQVLLKYSLGIRCLIPNNYIIWEATRPISDCEYCLNVTTPIVLHNLSRNDFRVYAYSSKPIIIKKAFSDWPATKYFNFTFLKHMYDHIEGSYKSIDDECQFLHFNSDFMSLKDVFSMNVARAENQKGTKSWYVGWGNCHIEILQQLRKHYRKPHFLPIQSELSSKEYIFMGYNDGATMHLDFISRLMWQAQLKGSKLWILKPTPECNHICKNIMFLVEPGDAVLVDTRVWYHGTAILHGEFSLSIQSEYG